MTGYPSIDKPWLKYYPQPRDNFVQCGLYEYMHKCNSDNLNEIAMIYFGNKWTFEELFKKVDRLSSAFISSGICAGDHVIVLGLNTPDIICAIYALNNIGAVSVIEYITQQEQSLEEVCRSFNASAAVVVDAVADKYYASLQNAGIKQIFISAISDSMPYPLKILASKKNKYNLKSLSTIAGKKRSEYSFKPYSWQGTETAVILSTSGTTGIPKKAELSNNAINALAYQAVYVNLGLRPGTKILSPCPPFLAYGISLSIHLPLCNGVAIIACPSPDPKQVIKQFRKYKPNFFIGGRAFLDRVLSDKAINKMDLSFIQAICIGGEAVSQEYRDTLTDFIIKRGSTGVITTGYGMTECAASSTIGSKTVNRDGSVGIPLCDVNIKVVDTESGEELGYDVEGEIMINSPCMMTKYWNNQEETHRTIENDNKGTLWIHSGDLGKIDRDGYVYIVGRLKRIFITIDPTNNSQVKLYPDYIEMLLNQMEEIENSAVIIKNHDVLRSVPVAFLCLKKGCDVKPDSIDEKLRKKTAVYNCPKEYFILDSFPLLANGKIDYQKLQKQYSEKIS